MRTRNRLREQRERVGLERYDISAALRVSVDTVRRWEHDQGNPIPSKYIPALAELLDTDPLVLMGWEKQETAA